MYVRTKDGVYVLSEAYWAGNKDEILNQSENLEELCDEFVFNSDISNYVIDKKFIEHTKEIILKIYKENDETDYVKAMHPKFYGAIWVNGKGLIYVAKMNDKGELELI